MTQATLAPALEVVRDAAQAALAATFAAIFGERPQPRPAPPEGPPSPCVAGIIAFTGDVSWSLALVLEEKSAPALIRGFTGFDIAFDCPNMGDAVAELVNVLAGDVVLELDKRRVKAKMAIPMVARGCPLELMAARSSTVTRLDYASKHGALWLALVAR